MVLQVHDDPLLSVSRSQLSSSDPGASDSVGLLSACDYNPHSHHTLQVSEHCNTTAHSMRDLISWAFPQHASQPCWKKGFSVRYLLFILIVINTFGTKTFENCRTFLLLFFTIFWMLAQMVVILLWNSGQLCFLTDDCKCWYRTGKPIPWTMQS